MTLTRNAKYNAMSVRKINTRIHKPLFYLWLRTPFLFSSLLQFPIFSWLDENKHDFSIRVISYHPPSYLVWIFALAKTTIYSSKD